MPSVPLSRNGLRLVLLLSLGCGTAAEAPPVEPPETFDAARSDSAEPRVVTKAPEARLTLRTGTQTARSVELTPLGRTELPPGGRVRPLGPVFEARVAPGDRDVALELRAEATLPSESTTPEGLVVVWLEERRDGSVEERILDTTTNDASWSATLDEAPLDLMRAFVFVALAPSDEPELKRECAVALPPAALDEREARCGDEQGELVAQALRGLCERGADLDDAVIEQGLRELPCLPTPADLDALLVEVVR